MAASKFMELEGGGKYIESVELCVGSEVKVDIVDIGWGVVI